MRNMILRLILPVLFLGLAPMAYAQEDERPEFKMPCQQALKLGLNKFMDVYGKRMQDYSTFGQKQGFEYWANCKRPANDALATKRLSTERRQQLESAREEFNKFGTSLWGLRYLEEGGGTMWGLISVGAYAERENFMESLIQALALPAGKSASARRRVNTSLARIQGWLSNKERTPYTEGSEPEDVRQREKAYQENIRETRASLEKLRDLLTALPDRAAARLAKALAHEAKNALDDTPE
jgi:hypothetical protein